MKSFRNGPRILPFAPVVAALLLCIASLPAAAASARPSPPAARPGERDESTVLFRGVYEGEGRVRVPGVDGGFDPPRQAIRSFVYDDTHFVVKDTNGDGKTTLADVKDQDLVFVIARPLGAARDGGKGSGLAPMVAEWLIDRTQFAGVGSEPN
jgi:hypothetical protein